MRTGERLQSSAKERGRARWGEAERADLARTCAQRKGLFVKAPKRKEECRSNRRPIDGRR